MPQFLSITGHARMRMRRRNISESEVRDALNAVSTSYPGASAGSTVYLGVTRNGRRLKVVLDDSTSALVTVADRDDSR